MFGNWGSFCTYPSGKYVHITKEEKEMTTYEVTEDGKVGETAFKKGQIIVHDGKKNADVKDGDKYIAVSVFIPEGTLESAVMAGILAELSE